MFKGIKMNLVGRITQYSKIRIPIPYSDTLKLQMRRNGKKVEISQLIPDGATIRKENKTK